MRLHQTVTRAYQVNQNIKFEVFIHKVDGLTDDRKIGESRTATECVREGNRERERMVICPTEAQRDIHQHATEDLSDAGLEGIHLSFYLTSIYDHSIFEVLY